MNLLKKSDGTIIARNIEFADTMLKQTIGLMFRRDIPEDFAMIFDVIWEQYVDIHMMFVTFPIDLVYLNNEKKIVDLKKGLKPWTGMATPKSPARYVIEMPVGTVEKFYLKEGGVLEW
ncbi:hypothetical protein CUJ83_06945 [Methanocella sp. CWC-04]|uniref:DUF192 domain-containing protein n=1 Tax=Methanooceanicella nereidis TaxID=2052831 RepID=A0AAP2W6Z2_9EURY|nr:DUF192 domain-containing protein [Methanocella sp. CWC-04]MCD1294734.1 hypothetical protein [Methanocella sp. CWC-04]